MDSNWFKELFINEAKVALNKGATISSEQINSAVNKYLEDNPVESAVASIENNILKVT
ncbi:MAG: hypothetical protein IIW98_06140 [Bacteroidaceae bacterium]|nr:hypothetical protein [Bacteroidaceae bacterium]